MLNTKKNLEAKSADGKLNRIILNYNLKFYNNILIKIKFFKIYNLIYI